MVKGSPDNPNSLLLEDWEIHLRSTKAARTVTLYLAIAAQFLAWLETEGRTSDLTRIAHRDCEAWFAHMRTGGLAQATRRSRWIALRNLFGWLLDEQEITVDPMARVKVAKADPAPIRVVSTDELGALLAACEGQGFTDRRDLALIRFMAATGVRVSEACSLKVTDIDPLSRIVDIRGKGDKVRRVRFDPTTAEAITRYRRARARHRLASSTFFWLGLHGPLSRKGVPAILDKRAKIAGIGHVHPHMLRHRFAHAYLHAGGTEGGLQKLGGWANAEVMRRYGSALAEDRALSEYDVVNPMEGL